MQLSSFWFLKNSAGPGVNMSVVSDQHQETCYQCGVSGSSIYAVTIRSCIRDAEIAGGFNSHAKDAFPPSVYYFEDILLS